MIIGAHLATVTDMALLGRPRPRPEPVQEPQPPTRFDGGWIHDSAGFPYEFDIGTGEHIPVHQMDFVGVDYRVDPPRLTIRFAYGAPRTETEDPGPPFAVFQFDGMRMWRWEDDVDAHEVPEDALGQVESFDWHASTGTFDLHTVNTRLLFSARRLTVRVEPEVHWVAEPDTTGHPPADGSVVQDLGDRAPSPDPVPGR